MTSLTTSISSSALKIAVAPRKYKSKTVFERLIARQNDDDPVVDVIGAVVVFQHQPKNGARPYFLHSERDQLIAFQTLVLGGVVKKKGLVQQFPQVVQHDFEFRVFVLHGNKPARALRKPFRCSM